MKNILIILLFLVAIVGCKSNEKPETKTVEDAKTDIAYASFGEEIIADDALTAESMAKHYETMRVGDTIQSKLVAKVDEVCQSKGCWMKLDLDNGEQVMVKFKDYGFFMPKDIAGKEVVINGKAFVDEMSVEDQRHYAEDGGESAEAIAAITTPKKTYSFEADGVLVKE